MEKEELKQILKEALQQKAESGAWVRHRELLQQLENPKPTPPPPPSAGSRDGFDWFMAVIFAIQATSLAAIALVLLFAALEHIGTGR